MTACEHVHECDPGEMLRLRDRIHEIADGVHAIQLDVAVMKLAMTAVPEHERRLGALERWRSRVHGGLWALAAAGAVVAWLKGLLAGVIALLGGPKG